MSEIRITGRMIRAVRNLYKPGLGGWPVRMTHGGEVAVYPYKNPTTGRHAKVYAIRSIRMAEREAETRMGNPKPITP